MTKRESDRLKDLFMERSKDFWPEWSGEFDDEAWRLYLEKIKVRMIEEDELCEAYNNRTNDTVLVECPHMGMNYPHMDVPWMVMPRELALKCLVLGQMPPRYSKKPTKKR
jgi:hypothetical protein